MRNHTKDKGDIGVAFVISHLVEKGYYICLPMSEHLPFDLVVVDDAGRVSRLQVKYRQLIKGCLELPCKSVYSNRKGAHIKKHDFTKFDAYALYCPQTKKVYYIPTREIVGITTITLRVEPEKVNNRRIRRADDFLAVEKIFGGVP